MPTVAPHLPVPVDEPIAEGPVAPRVPRLDGTAVVMGLPFDRLDQATLVRLFREGIRNRRGGWIVTPNLDILRRFSRDPESRQLIMAASHRVADGTPIVWASRLGGTPVPERIAGSELALSLPAAAAETGARLLLLGGNPGVAEAAARRLESMHPRLGRVAFHCPPFGYEDDPVELARIRAVVRKAEPDLVLVGLGFPKQERLIRSLRSELPQAWFAGVGVSLSFVAGEQKRAPALMQRLGLEWMHRLCREPRRLFRRYLLQGLPFSLQLFTWAFNQRLREPSIRGGPVAGTRHRP